MNTKQLQHDYMRDLIVEVRCAERDGLHEYAQKCRDSLRRLWKTRHSPKIDKYGVPQ